MELGARPADPSDGAELARLADSCAQELARERGGPLFLAKSAVSRPPLRDYGSNAGTAAWLGTIDDVSVGFAVARTYATADHVYASVDGIYVEPEARGVGVGAALVGAVIGWATEQGCRGIDSVALPGTRATKNFFEAWGFTARALIVHRPLGVLTVGQASSVGAGGLRGDGGGLRGDGGELSGEGGELSGVDRG